MKLIWSKSKLPLSVIIRAVTGEDCSHFAFVFETRGAGIMFESNLIGTHPSFFKNSLKSHTIVHEIEIPLDMNTEDLIWDACVENFDGKPYDFLGIVYLGWRKLLLRFLGKPLPEKNKWSREGALFCDELYSILNIIPEFPFLPVMNGMQTPHDIWDKLKDVKFVG
jgi:hypothetical protein